MLMGYAPLKVDDENIKITSNSIGLAFLSTISAMNQRYKHFIATPIGQVKICVRLGRDVVIAQRKVSLPYFETNSQWASPMSPEECSGLF